jgi:hypothetical protein
MRKLTKLQLACAVLVAVFAAGYANAFNASKYATQSKLATGKWVKITIPESGMYELTYDELRQMGFTNPAQVQVYGRGGAKINEVLDGMAMDDLTTVPILRTKDKICFYGNGPISFSITDYTSNARFVRTFNPYSQVGCYFLTEESRADHVPAKKVNVTVNNFNNKPYSLGFFYHERDMFNSEGTGKDMLGEDFSAQNLLVDYNLPDLADSTIIVHVTIAANASDVSYANGILYSGGVADTTVYSTSSSRIYKPSSDNVFYNYASPAAKLKLTHPAEKGQFQPWLKFAIESPSISLARLDYFILTYTHSNILRESGDNQLLMGYGATSGSERFMLPDASSSTVVWCISNNSMPQEVTTTSYSDETGQGLAFFSTSASNSMYVAFDPTKRLKKIAEFEPVANQNLHGMQTPDMLIITTKDFMGAAQRLADLHRTMDGIDVAVVDHEKIFNEFSSGVRDGMAYRLLCKMLYDRDGAKFKNLLLFGTGSFDNREVMGKHPTNLLTYQSDNSNYEDYSFTTDDFFGFLDDNSGSNISGEKLRIGVGRITCGDVEEAESDVDKIVEYYATPDYGVWRNHAIVLSDSPDGGMYMFQGQGYKDQIEKDLNPGMHVNTVHNSQYPRSTIETFDEERKTATEAKQHLANLLKDGAYYATYVGHAGAVSFTKKSRMWTTGDVARNNYSRWPIMSTACCNVAHYDGDTRGIGELMFHKRNGGAIALLATSRMVYASGNDLMNQYFINSLFTPNQDGSMPTLGEVYKNSKLSFTSSNVNKLSFFLLGDPGMKVNYPLPLFKVTSVNGVNVADTTKKAQIGPLNKFEVRAQVVDAEGNLDSGFNGDATVTLYDKEVLCTSLTFTVSGFKVDRDIYFDRPMLAQISGRVVNGVFTGTMIAPKAPSAKDEDVLLRVYAHKDGSTLMVNGQNERITMLSYDENTVITDSQSPVINSMYINDEATFNDGAVIGSDAILYINVTDNEGINMQSNSVDNSMRLVLDGGKQSYSDITCYATPLDGNKSVNVEVPIASLPEGMHTLQYTVYDMFGNSATRTITFVVGQSTSANLVADKVPAYVNDEVNFDLDTDLTRIDEVILRVTDATGKLVWMTTTSSFPVTWDMKDMDGNKVPAGLYRYFGTYSDGTNHGGTPINKLVVLDALKTSN